MSIEFEQPARLWPWITLVTVYGACIGSFLNVLIYRLPEGLSIVSPPSSCPRCKHRLAWYDNIPVLGWIVLRGRCRYCKSPISIQYPLIEAFTALLFGGYFSICYLTDLRPDFAQAGWFHTWPAMAVALVLLAAMLAVTVIDARLYLIPLHIPWAVSVIALLALPIGAHFLPEVADVSPGAEVSMWGAIMGAMTGLGLSALALKLGLMPRSFPDDPYAGAGSPVTEEQGKDAKPQAACAMVEEHGTPEDWLAHPHPRREVLKEILFLAPPLLGALLGSKLIPGHWLESLSRLDPSATTVLFGVMLGYLVGGLIVWGTRILGTLAFGKEAMGLGDVHLLAAIACVIGPIDCVFVFFIAPFMGLAFAVGTMIAARLRGEAVRVIPYGPYLAAAAVIMMIFRFPIMTKLGIVTP